MSAYRPRYCIHCAATVRYTVCEFFIYCLHRAATLWRDSTTHTVAHCTLYNRRYSTQTLCYTVRCQSVVNLDCKKFYSIFFRCGLYYRPGQSAHSETQCALCLVLTVLCTVYYCVAYSVTMVLCAASTTANSSIQPMVLLLN